jgi:hypothetical protein
MSTGLQLSKLWCPLFLHLLCTCPSPSSTGLLMSWAAASTILR